MKDEGSRMEDANGAVCSANTAEKGATIGMLNENRAECNANLRK